MGSIGRRCWIALLMSACNDPLFLQLKEAIPSVLEPFPGKSTYPHHGQRVVIGQRLMQPASELFLGWGTSEATNKQFMCGNFATPRSSPLWRPSIPRCFWVTPRMGGRTGSRQGRKLRRGSVVISDQATSSIEPSAISRWPTPTRLNAIMPRSRMPFARQGHGLLGSVIETRGFEAGGGGDVMERFVADIVAVDGGGRVVNDHQLADLTAGAPNVASASSRWIPVQGLFGMSFADGITRRSHSARLEPGTGGFLKSLHQPEAAALPRRKCRAGLGFAA